MERKPLVSIIIAVKNEERNIERIITSCLKQKYKPIEIIVVDNYSTDRTPEIAQQFHIRFFTKGPERSTQRIYGAQQAKGEYLYFLDADMELPSRTIAECIDVITNNQETGGIIIPEISVGTTFWAKAKALERSSYIGDVSVEAARFFPKQIFFEIGEYNTNLISGEDWDLSQRVRERYPIRRIHIKVIHHEGKLRLKGILKKKYYYAQHIRRYFQEHPKTKQQKNILFRKAYFKNWKNFAKHPIITLGVIIMRTLELTVGVIGYIKGIFQKNKS